MSHPTHILPKTAPLAVAAALVLLLTACSTTTVNGNPYSIPDRTPVPQAIEILDDAVPLAVAPDAPVIDANHADEGYFIAAAASDKRLKLQVSCGEMSYNYDMPQDGSAVVVPANMGDGEYCLRVMENAGGKLYAEVCGTSATVALSSEAAPYTVPNLYCDYSASSPCAAKAREIAADANTQARAAAAVCEWVAKNISYDEEKADALAEGTGYIPSPDATLAEGSGICFDHASLAAAMCRSIGIPAKVITGYVGPEQVYHAWVEVLADGDWESANFSIRAEEWSRCDVAFAAAGTSSLVGDGTSYVARYTY